MKTKNEVILTSMLIDRITENFEEKEYAPFKYAFLRNRMKFKKVLEERNEIIEFLSKEYKEKFPIPEDTELHKSYDEDFSKYVGDQDKFKDFLKEEVDFEYYTISVKTMEKSEYNLSVALALVDTILTE